MWGARQLSRTGPGRLTGLTLLTALTSGTGLQAVKHGHGLFVDCAKSTGFASEAVDDAPHVALGCGVETWAKDRRWTPYKSVIIFGGKV